MSQGSSSTWQGILGSVIVLILVLGFCYACYAEARNIIDAVRGDEKGHKSASDPAEAKKGDGDNNAEGVLAPASAKYPKPYKEPIEVGLRTAGSKGGAYAVREATWEDDDLGENFGIIFNLGDPDFTGTLRSRPTEHTFDMDDGVWKDKDGKLQWDDIVITVDKTGNSKAGEWEGEMYAKLYVNGELVDCGNTDSSSAIRFEWSPPDGTAGWTTKAACSTYPGF